MAEILKACASCGRAMNPNAALYDAEARAICEACFQMVDLVATDRRAADNIRKAGYACLASGIASLFAPAVNVVFLVACILVVGSSAIFAMQSLARGNERFTRHLTPLQQRIVWVCTIAGLVLMALSLMGMNFSRLIW
jgi:hypothetical protein